MGTIDDCLAELDGFKRIVKAVEHRRIGPIRRRLTCRHVYVTNSMATFPSGGWCAS